MEAIFKKWVLPAIYIILLALFINRFVLFQIVVTSGSMSPTIKTGDHILILRHYVPQDMKNGDVVVFKSDNKGQRNLVIKRLIGTPGDHIIFEEGHIILNGEPLEETYVDFCDCFSGEFNIPQGRYFFCGDCRSNSKDSRDQSVGCIAEKDILGTAGLRIWPLSRFGFIR